jgi:protein involved in polysaccharide export with SLBB domain
MQQQQFKKIVFIALTILLIATNVTAQDLLKGNNLANIRVDQVSDAEIAKLKAQLSAQGMTIDQTETIALAKGMRAAEFAKLKDRVKNGGINNAAGTNKTSAVSAREPNANDKADAETYNNPTASNGTLINPLIFGSELYTSVAPSFEPNMSLATPLNYVLGPNDQIAVSVYGVQEYNGELSVSPEGNISIPNVGLIRVAGLTIEAATQKIKNTMGAKVFTYLKSGGSKINVTLSKIRTIKVTILGASRPATYRLSSLSTVFNALYVSGGPSAFGSFREIELLRDNKLYKKIDLYRLLLSGDQSDNIGLQDNDVIRIPTYKTRVSIEGQVKRPGIFEVLPNENFATILTFASGFTDNAYKASVKVYAQTNKERQLKDLPQLQYNSYLPQVGDVFVVSEILNRFTNRVKIAGAVYRPDIFELTPNLKVADLIGKADGLKEDAYTGRAQIIRLEEDLTRTVLSFDVIKALNNDAASNFILQREDEVIITSKQDLRENFTIYIQGEIRKPGNFDYVEGLTLKDLILQAGGFKDAAFKNIEIARLIKRDSIEQKDFRVSEIIRTEVDGDISKASASIKLLPFDVVTIKRKAGYTLPESVRISGQVQYPGPYALSARNERVSAILKRAGGYLPDAFIEGAYLLHIKSAVEKNRDMETLESSQKVLNDPKGLQELAVQKVESSIKVPLNLSEIMTNPGSTEDLVLKVGDEIYIPKQDGQIKVSGAVLLTTQIPYSTNNSFNNYITAAGGYVADALKSKAYIVYANGKASKTRRFLFFNIRPKVMPGSEIVVPLKLERKKSNTSTTEIIGISSAVASMVGLVISILKL